MNILIIGQGNMGRTYASGFLAGHLIPPENLFFLTRSPDHTLFKNIPKKNIFNQADERIINADVIILAVKPQDFISLSEKIKSFIRPHHVILSVMAGITINKITVQLKTSKIVRSMPNLPSQVGMGMTVFTCHPSLEKKDLFIVQNLINATGKSVYVEEEHLIDAATAISGSGPAYVYFFMEAMISAALEMGFNRSQSELLVNQTFLGAVHLQNQSELSCAEWISKVRSKGGTTEAALNEFENADLSKGIIIGLKAAMKRAVELGS